MPLHVYVAAVLLFTHHGYSQKMGDTCLIEHTSTLGFCAPAATCQSARRDYETNRITPTFCNRSIKTVIVCCSDESSILNTAPTNTNNNNNNNSGRRPLWSNNQQTIRDNRRLSEKKCEEYSPVIKTVDYLPLVPGGEAAKIGEFPHMAAIGWTNFEGTYSFLCGGSLISPKFVLTAAHCTKYPKMKDPYPVIVRLGDQNLDPKKNDSASPIDIPIKNIRKHPHYKSPGKYHDIALLELASAIDFDAGIKPVCLWNKPHFAGHTKAVAIGWGVVDPLTLRTSDELQKVSLTLFENDYCNSLLRTKKNRLWADGFTVNQMCAGELEGGKDTCQGDSGSPLQVMSCEDKCVFRVIGVTSFGYKCAQSGTPSVYTRVSSYLYWIESVVWPGES